MRNRIFEHINNWTETFIIRKEEHWIIMEKLTLPNTNLIRYLYDKYYVKEKTSQDNFVSSHWKFHSKDFDVRLDIKDKIYIYISPFRRGVW